MSLRPIAHHVFLVCSSVFRRHRLFRSLAGLDDPDEEAPTVIVSRSGGSHVGARHVTDTSEPEKHMVTVSRARSFLSNRKSFESFKSADDEGEKGKPEDRESGEFGIEKEHKGRWKSRSLVRVGGDHLHLISAQPGTWAAFTREHRRDSDVEVVVTRSADFRSSNGNHRSETGYRESHRSPEYCRSYRVGGLNMAAESRAPMTPKSSTVSKWNQQSVQVQETDEHVHRRALVDGEEEVVVGEEEKCVNEHVQVVGEGTGEDEPRALSWRRVAYSRPRTRQLGGDNRDGPDEGDADVKIIRSDTTTILSRTTTTSTTMAEVEAVVPSSRIAITPHKKIISLASSSSCSEGLDASDMHDFPSLSNSPRNVLKARKAPTPPDAGSGLITPRLRMSTRGAHSPMKSRRGLRGKGQKRSRSQGRVKGEREGERAVGK